MKPLPAAIIASHDEHGVGIALEGGASLDVRVLEPSLLRVTLRPAAGYREPRTWAIAPTAGQDVAWSGRERDDLTGFSRPAAEVQVKF